MFEALQVMNDVREREAGYVSSVVPEIDSIEEQSRRNAAVIGAQAEKYFLEWCVRELQSWGDPEDLTDRVGIGYDIRFASVDRFVEIKGFRQEVDAIRMTRKEWQAAQRLADSYFLALVSQLDGSAEPHVSLVRNPFSKLQHAAQKRQRVQVTYTLPGSDVSAAAESPGSFRIG